MPCSCMCAVQFWLLFLFNNAPALVTCMLLHGIWREGQQLEGSAARAAPIRLSGFRSLFSCRRPS